MTQLENALAFLERHPQWFIFPCAFDDRRPLIKDNLAKASNDPAQIEKWNRKHRRVLWALSIKKSGLVVIDVDGDARGKRPDKMGWQTFQKLLKEHPEMFAKTYVVKSPNGYHLFYVGEHRFGGSRLGKHIDVPNYCMIEGTVRADGGEYKVFKDRPVALITAELQLMVKPLNDRPRTFTGPAMDYKLFCELLRRTPYVGGPEGLTDRRGYDGWLKFSMAVHEAAGGDESVYMNAWLDWCDADDERSARCSSEKNMCHWQSFSVDNETSVTRASWFKLMKHFGEHELLGYIRAVEDFESVED